MFQGQVALTQGLELFDREISLSLVAISTAGDEIGKNRLAASFPGDPVVYIGRLVRDGAPAIIATVP